MLKFVICTAVLRPGECGSPVMAAGGLLVVLLFLFVSLDPDHREPSREAVDRPDRGATSRCRRGPLQALEP